MKPTEILHTIEFAGLILGIVALAVGVYHVIEIRKALANLAKVQNSLSTQYLGKFPYFLDRIVELIETARYELVVFCDFPGYADLTEPGKALEYRQALERKVHSADVRVEVTFLDPRVDLNI